MEYADVGGGWLRSQSWIDAAGSAAAVATAIQAATNANLAFVTNAIPIAGTTTPASALYQSVQDVLIITLQTAIPTYIQVTVPAPLGTMFLAGGVNIDPANATWIALLAAINANVTDVMGNAPTALVSAVKSSRRNDQ